MYLDFEDYRPDISRLERAISSREGILVSIIFHLMIMVFISVAPRWFPPDANAARARAVLLEQQEEEPIRFVFVQPRVDLRATKPTDRGEASDQDRMARTRERAPNLTNPLPFARGNSPERVERMEPQAPRGQGPAPDPAAGQPNRRPSPADAQDESAVQQVLAESKSTLQVPPTAPEPSSRVAIGGGSLGDTLRNLQRYVQRDAFDNQQGGSSQFGPEIQFDTMGVEFGPWIRRFIAQVKRNWLIPYAAWSMQGHVVITFNVHKGGSITDLRVVEPCPIDAFNHAAFGALASSNPTGPLPTEYPADKAFFTVTFFYNEVPPR